MSLCLGMARGGYFSKSVGLTQRSDESGVIPFSIKETDNCYRICYYIRFEEHDVVFDYSTAISFPCEPGILAFFENGWILLNLVIAYFCCIQKVSCSIWACKFFLEIEVVISSKSFETESVIINLNAKLPVCFSDLHEHRRLFPERHPFRLLQSSHTHRTCPSYLHMFSCS
jgi:hypothetical protein